MSYYLIILQESPRKKRKVDVKQSEEDVGEEDEDVEDENEEGISIQLFVSGQHDFELIFFFVDEDEDLDESD